MILVHAIRILSLGLAAATLVVVPLASPLLVSLGLILLGLLVAWRGAADIMPPPASRDVVFPYSL